MDKKQWHKQLIREIYEENIAMPFSNRELKLQAVYDEIGDHYLIMVFGIHNDDWRHYCIAHIDLIDEKIVIQHDSVGYSIAQELYDRGVPDADMVLAYQISGFNPQLEGEGYKHIRELAGVS